MAQLFYMEKDDEIAYSIDYFNDMKDEMEGEQIILYEMKREFGTGLIWCSMLQECFETSEEMCGKNCDEYKPRNGKSGRCRFADVCLTETGKKFLLTKNGLNELNSLL